MDNDQEKVVAPEGEQNVEVTEAEQTGEVIAEATAVNQIEGEVDPNDTAELPPAVEA